jgi:opacity protein-like surface antigen
MHGARTVAPALDKALSRLYERSPMKLNHLTFALAALLLTATAPAADNDGWISMFNGTDLSGWKSNEEVPGSFTVSDGTLKVSGGRAHIFFTGADGAAKFKNFEFKAKVKTTAGSNGGIYFHTKFQEKGWPDLGYECQVNSTHTDPKKTGSLYGVVNILALQPGQAEPQGGTHIKVPAAPSKDDEWFDYVIRVEGKHITLKVNGQTTVDFTEPEGWDPAKELKNMPGRKLSEGTIAIQGHDPKSTCFYKDLFIKPL